MAANLDPGTVAGFGDEWRRFDQSRLDAQELREQFERYFRIFPWDELPEGAAGFDLGCGSGRWARLVAPRVGRLVCIDPSEEALAVARRNLEGAANCEFILASVDDLPLEDGSMDFGYALGVLHHVPDTSAGLRRCVEKLKPGAPFLLYLYYALDNRPLWFRLLWRSSDAARRAISKLPLPLRYAVTQVIALVVYFPLARLALAHERLGAGVGGIPLSSYRRASLYTMRTDARDRFGTRLEKRFSRQQIERMMEDAGLASVRFSDAVPYWCAVGYRKRDP